MQAGQILKTTGNVALDNSLNQEGNFLHNVFGIAPNLFIFDDGRQPNAFASPQSTMPGYSGTVYLGRTLLATELWSMAKGSQAVAGIMAHEFAHVLQFESGTKSSGKYLELQADYLAGYYLGKKSYLSPTNLRAFATSLYEKGDYNFWSPAHHGTPEERVKAMMAGFAARDLSLDEAHSQGERFVRGRSPERDPMADEEPSTRWKTVTDECKHRAHPVGDLSECTHGPLHYRGDLVPCSHEYYDGYGRRWTQHQADAIPCEHPAHPRGDLSPCTHLLHPEGHPRKVRVK